MTKEDLIKTKIQENNERRKLSTTCHAYEGKNEETEIREIKWEYVKEWLKAEKNGGIEKIVKTLGILDNSAV